MAQRTAHSYIRKMVYPAILLFLNRLEDEYLFLPDENYELDDSVKARMESDDHFFVSYGTNKKETIIFKSVTFKQNGLLYHLYTNDNINGEALFQMAAKMIG